MTTARQFPDPAASPDLADFIIKVRAYYEAVYGVIPKWRLYANAGTTPKGRDLTNVRMPWYEPQEAAR